jgi:hypothetical protein
LLATCLVLLAGVDLPWLARIGMCVGAASLGWRQISTTVLLRGARSPRALVWTHSGQLTVEGADGRVCPVTLRAGSFRLGRAGIFLWLRSCDRTQGLFIEAGRQGPPELRRLIRWLNCHSGMSPGEPGPPS